LREREKGIGTRTFIHCKIRTTKDGFLDILCTVNKSTHGPTCLHSTKRYKVFLFRPISLLTWSKRSLNFTRHKNVKRRIPFTFQRLVTMLLEALVSSYARKTFSSRSRDLHSSFTASYTAEPRPQRLPRLYSCNILHPLLQEPQPPPCSESFSIHGLHLLQPTYVRSKIPFPFAFAFAHPSSGISSLIEASLSRRSSFASSRFILAYYSFSPLQKQARNKWAWQASFTVAHYQLIEHVTKTPFPNI